MKRMLILTAALSLVQTAIFAAPNYVIFQATVATNAQGDLLPAGVYTVELNFYNAASGGTKLWGPYLFDNGSGNGHAAKVTVLAPGRISVAIGPMDTAGRAITGAFKSSACYVEIKINTTTISPRQQFLTAPFAFNMPNVSTRSDCVGVGGITSPVATLDVNGTLRAGADIAVNGKLSVNTISVTSSVTGIGSAPIGSIIAWHKSLTGVGALPANWVECNGGMVSDGQSPINGQAIPQLNKSVGPGMLGAFLRGDTASGATQGANVKDHQHSYRDDYFIQSSSEWQGGAVDYNYMGWSKILVQSSDPQGSDETRPYSYTVVWIMRIK